MVAVKLIFSIPNLNRISESNQINGMAQIQDDVRCKVVQCIESFQNLQGIHYKNK
jgi:hypothetical protein